MNLGTFRKLTQNFPDSYEIRIDCPFDADPVPVEDPEPGVGIVNVDSEQVILKEGTQQEG